MVRTEEIRVDRLCVDTVQSRDEAWTGDDEDRQLAASIAQTGLLQDILVRPVEQMGGDTDRSSDADYAIVAGSRRYHAAMEAGQEYVRCKILDATDLEAAWQSLSENTDRRSLSEQEIAQQLRLIYEMVRPRADVSTCPACGADVEDEDGLVSHCQQTDCQLPSEQLAGDEGPVPTHLPDGRCETDHEALTYLAEGFLGRSDQSALSLVEGHLRTAELPPVLQALFKASEERSAAEKTALENHGIDATETLGSGEGKSGTSREVVALHETISEDLDEDTVDPTNAVLQTIGDLQFQEMSEQKLRRTLRSFRQDLTSAIDTSQPADTQRQTFVDTLATHTENLREMYEQIEPQRPFRKVDVLGPESERHSRWHARLMQRRDASGHGELVRELYQERLETLADQEGWD